MLKNTIYSRMMTLTLSKEQQFDLPEKQEQQLRKQNNLYSIGGVYVKTFNGHIMYPNHLSCVIHFRYY